MAKGEIMAGGRPTSYRQEYARQAQELCFIGYTDEQLAKFFGVAKSTINKWKHDFPEFSDSLKEGKAVADGRVARSLFERACGYSHPEDKIFNNNGEEMIVRTMKHYPPDSTSMIFWLKNRQREHWRDKPEDNQKEEASPSLAINFTVNDAKADVVTTNAKS